MVMVYSLTTDQVKTGWRKAGDSTIDFILVELTFVALRFLACWFSLIVPLLIVHRPTGST